MKRFDLNKIIEATGTDKLKLASVLFPKHLYPMSALRRVLAGEAELDVSQLYRLADFLGIDAPTLLAPSQWKASATKDTIDFRCGPYLARITKGFNVSLYESGALIEEFLINSQVITLTDFINLITTKTKKYGKL